MDFVKRYLESTLRSRAIHERAKKVMPGGVTRGVLFFKPYPAYAKRGSGSRIWDEDGNGRIDYCFNYTVLILGHSHPKVKKAIAEQLENGTALGAPTELEVALAEEVSQRVKYAEMVRFTPSGSEAVMFALRAARAYTGRDKIALFEGGYHGSYDTVVAQSAGIPAGAVKDAVHLPYNDAQKAEKTLKVLRDELAAVIVEPVIGANGPIPPRGDFLRHLREITETLGCLLIFDEIITGFRLSHGGSGEVFGVEPDLATFGKIIGGGLPASAFSGRKEIMRLFEYPGSPSLAPPQPKIPHSGTYTAHPLAMAAGLATLRELTPDVYQRLNSTGEAVMEGLRKLSSELGITYQVSGFGSVFNVFFTDREIVNYGDVKGAERQLTLYFGLGLLTRGVYFSPGHICNVSSATSRRDVELTLEAAADTLEAMKPLIRETAPALVST